MPCSECSIVHTSQLPLKQRKYPSNPILLNFVWIWFVYSDATKIFKVTLFDNTIVSDWSMMNKQPDRTTNACLWFFPIHIHHYQVDNYRRMNYILLILGDFVRLLTLMPGTRLKAVLLLNIYNVVDHLAKVGGQTLISSSNAHLTVTRRILPLLKRMSTCGRCLVLH